MVPVLVALVLGGVAAVACGDASGPSGTQGGDDFTNDTRDSSVRAPGNPDDGATLMGQPDGAYATGQPEAGYYTDGTMGYGEDDGGPVPESYPGVAECSACSCPATASYCFGGATPRNLPMIVTPFTTDAATGDGAAPACPVVAAGALGCSALPAGATNCSSLLMALQPTYACYLVCAYNGTTMTVYCPNP
jgi:hypothetical protein